MSPLVLPDLDAPVLRVVAGVRPFRRNGPRIEAESADAKLLVHAYGHGGAGVTLAWGTAARVVALARPAGARAPCAVLGAGVIGCAAAVALAEAGHAVRVLAACGPLDSTSAVAGAEFCPDYLGALDAAGRARVAEDLARAHAALVALPSAWGVVRIDSYAADGVPTGYDLFPAGILPSPERVPAARFPGGRTGGTRVASYVVETQRFLPCLEARARALGVRFERRTFGGRAEILALPEPVVVVALGAGAAVVTGDADLVPARGQLVHLAPQPLGYSVTHADGYVIPRSDTLLVGGTFELGVDDMCADGDAGATILARNRVFFGAPPV